MDADVWLKTWGMHGYRSLEGTFLGGAVFSGRDTDRVAAGAPA